MEREDTAKSRMTEHCNNGGCNHKENVKRRGSIMEHANIKKMRRESSTMKHARVKRSQEGEAQRFGVQTRHKDEDGSMAETRDQEDGSKMEHTRVKTLQRGRAQRWTMQMLRHCEEEEAQRWNNDAAGMRMAQRWSMQTLRRREEEGSTAERASRKDAAKMGMAQRRSMQTLRRREEEEEEEEEEGSMAERASVRRREDEDSSTLEHAGITTPRNAAGIERTRRDEKGAVSARRHWDRARKMRREGHLSTVELAMNRRARWALYPQRDGAEIEHAR
ncbi:hypothetical protein DFH06DRAFT_1134144 [Mycena polygramma]|nr:hypothetical protein DFH06DRAFT_1134144 [Mycena polygramma]